MEVLDELTPLFFALDYVNYSRWMPVHTRDVKTLPDTIKDEFKKHSHWVLSKTSYTSLLPSRSTKFTNKKTRL